MADFEVQADAAVARRALCLGALVKRSQLELLMQNASTLPVSKATQDEMVTEQRDENARLLKWVANEKLQHYLSARERDLLGLPLGGWDTRTLINASWRVEALGVLLWALRAIENLPGYDVQFWLDEVLEPLDVFTPTIDFVWCATLRSPELIHKGRDLAELWHWRARTTQIQKLGMKPPAGTSYTEIIRQAAEKAYNEGRIPEPINGDFPALDKAYADANEEEYTLLASISAERHFAFNWLCRHSDDWDSTPTDT